MKLKFGQSHAESCLPPSLQQDTASFKRYPFTVFQLASL